MMIDRFEGDIAVIETDDGFIEIEKTLLPEDASEGDIITEENGRYAVDHKATEERRKAVRSKLHRLIKRK